MKIGNYDLSKKLFLAPMAEITDSSFRRIAKEHGAGFTFTQMVSAVGVVRNNFDTLRFWSFNKSEKPIGVQILGNDPVIISEATKEISKFNPDLIDLNAGCSVDKVTGNNFGSALLEEPDKVGKIIRAMADSSNGIPISLKVRLGRDKNHINVIEIARTAEENGASLIFVHARTRVDKYRSSVDLSWIKKVKEKINIPVVGNGSTFTPADIREMIDTTGCDSVMVARGAIGNPFIFERYNQMVETGIDPGEPDIKTVSDVLLKLLFMLEKDYGEFNTLDKAKKHAIWFLRNYPGIDFLLDKIFTLTNLDDIKELITSHTNKIVNGQFKPANKLEIQKRFNERVLFWLLDEQVESEV